MHSYIVVLFDIDKGRYSYYHVMGPKNLVHCHGESIGAGHHIVHEQQLWDAIHFPEKYKTKIVQLGTEAEHLVPEENRCGPVIPYTVEQCLKDNPGTIFLFASHGY